MCRHLCRGKHTHLCACAGCTSLVASVGAEQKLGHSNSMSLWLSLSLARARSLSQAVTEKGQEIFRILVNALTLSKALVSVSGADKYEAPPTEQVHAVRAE